MRRKSNTDAPENRATRIASSGSERERLRNRLVRALKKAGEYQPAVDDFLIDQIVRNTIHSKNAEKFLNSNATELTYSRVADALAKFSKIINDAFHNLAITRRCRLMGEDETGIIKQLEKEILEEFNDAKK